jgi:hypothetical protein
MSLLGRKQADRFVQQGDLLLVPLDAKPDLAGLEEGPAVLAYGEVTGHSHRVVADEDGKVRFFRSDSNAYLLVEGGALLLHEEHGSHRLAPGWYESRIQREKTLEQAGWKTVEQAGWKRVVD